MLLYNSQALRHSYSLTSLRSDGSSGSESRPDKAKNSFIWHVLISSYLRYGYPPPDTGILATTVFSLLSIYIASVELFLGALIAATRKFI